MIVEQHTNIPGVVHNQGFDVTADALNAMQQYLAEELTERTKDFIKYPGFVWGLQVGNISGHSITITAGVGFDQEGRRLYHLSDTGYKISFPATGELEGNLCVKAYTKNIANKVHPYDGSRHSTEAIVGLEFFIETADSYLGSGGGQYPNGNNGLIITKLAIVEASYKIPDVTVRSPNIKMRDGGI